MNTRTEINEISQLIYDIESKSNKEEFEYLIGDLNNVLQISKDRINENGKIDGGLAFIPQGFDKDSDFIHLDHIDEALHNYFKNYTDIGVDILISAFEELSKKRKKLLLSLMINQLLNYDSDEDDSDEDDSDEEN